MKKTVKTSLHNNKFLANNEFYSPDKKDKSLRKTRLNVEDRLYSLAKINELKL